MPSYTEYYELINSSMHISDEVNGVKGVWFIAKNGKRIFFPAAGGNWDDHVQSLNSHGYYWTSYMNNNGGNSEAYIMDIIPYQFYASNEVHLGAGQRYVAYSVRPVKGPKQIKSIELSENHVNIGINQKTTIEATCRPYVYDDIPLLWTIDDESVASVIDGVITGKKAGQTIVHCKAASNGGAEATCSVTVIETYSHDFVDFGLPSGKLWATCNVGAKSPEELGNYYAWGETHTKDVYTWYNYQHCIVEQINGGEKITITKYKHGEPLEPIDDAATQNWGETWHMPTHDDISELLQYCEATNDILNGVPGVRFSRYGKSIFLPFGGSMKDNGPSYVGEYGAIWCQENAGEKGLYLYLYEKKAGASITSTYYDKRYTGLNIRAVCDSK